MASPHKRYLRPAVIVSTDPARQTCRVRYIDRPANEDFLCPLPHPFASPGWGILAVPTVGTRVYVSYTSRERPRIVSTIPLNQFSKGDFENVNDVQNVCVDESPYPALRPGELAIQSVSGANITMNRQGDIRFNINNSSVEYNSSLDTSSEFFVNKYVITEGSRHISGIVRRDIRDRPSSVEKSQDKLVSLDTDFNLADIGRNPKFEVQSLTVDVRVEKGDPQLSIIRNPALVENRTLVHEYALSDSVQTYDLESNIIDGNSDDNNGNQLFFDKNKRYLARTDVMNLGLHVPNNLIEKIEGTVVDYYGNILDINRNIIDFSNIKKRPNGENAVKERLETELALLRRSIKYHFEINSKKEVLAEKITPANQEENAAAPILDALGDDGYQPGGRRLQPRARPPDEALRTGYSHSRFSVDIDGEGLTKINIPASSNEGNIPLMSRYIGTFDPKDRNSGSYRNKNKRDIRHIGFGKPTVDIEAQNYVPENILEEGNQFGYGTVYHDFIGVIPELSTEQLFEQTLINDIDNPGSNAGGRSLHLNLDGSMDFNIGRDVADKKSILIDTAGSVVSMLGRDKNDNSIVSQIDGNVKMQVGGTSTPGDEELPANTVEIAIKTNIGYHKIVIDSTAMRFTSPGNMVFNPSGNLVLKAGGDALLDARGVFIFGDADDDGKITSRERTVLPNGQEIK